MEIWGDEGLGNDLSFSELDLDLLAYKPPHPIEFGPGD